MTKRKTTSSEINLLVYFKVSIDIFHIAGAVVVVSKADSRWRREKLLAVVLKLIDRIVRA